MSKVDLQQRLRDCIRLYLSKDNPKPETEWQRFHLFCQGRGAEGRARAQKYLSYLESERTASTLVNKIWHEIRSPHGKGELATSKQLRKRFIHAFRDYAGVRQAEVHQQNLTTLRRCKGPGLPAPFEALSLSSLFTLIEKKLLAMGLLHHTEDKGKAMAMNNLSL